jgi:hypothetical protein
MKKALTGIRKWDKSYSQVFATKKSVAKKVKELRKKKAHNIRTTPTWGGHFSVSWKE